MENPLPSLGQWYRWVLEDLEPTPGRLTSSLRVVAAVLLAMVVLLVLQLPFVSLVLYVIFVVGLESAAVSLRSALLSLIVGCAAVLVELTVVIATDNDPMARLLSVVVMTFVAGVLTQASSFAPLAPTFGLLYCTVIAIWENHIPADTNVKTSLYLIASESIALGSIVLVEYLFADKSSVDRLLAERRTSYRAIEAMFRAYARAATPDEIFAAYLPVARLALAGQRGMQDLYQVIVQRNLDPKGLFVGMRIRITQLAEFVDVSAAFGAVRHSADDLKLRERCEWIADRCHELGEGADPEGNYKKSKSGIAALRPVEETLEAILGMPLHVSKDDEQLIVLPANRIPFFIPGALKAKGTLAFGLKISLCATLCYILYHALDYPGISTAVTTVLVTSLTNTGAMKQKLAQRLAGATVGGLLFGLSSVVFLFPHMDSITALCGLIGIVAFIAAWVAAGRRFGYVGLQIAFSYLAVAVATASAPTALEPTRDRLVGVGVALVIMWFVFDQAWPVRTITMMRQALAVALRGEAQVISLADDTQGVDLSSKIDGLRHQISSKITEIRSLHEAVLYEFGPDHESHKAAGEVVLRAAVSSGALLWNQLAVLEREQDRDLSHSETVRKIRSLLAMGLEKMADAVVDHKPIVALDISQIAVDHLSRGTLEAEYTNAMVSRYKSVESILVDLPV
jgi:multidrug resistance protein MdtO